MPCHFTKASIVHPQECHTLIPEEPFFYLLAVTIHRLSDDVEVSAYLLEVTAILKDIDSIDELLLFIGANLREQIYGKHDFGITFCDFLKVLFLVFLRVKVLSLFTSLLRISRSVVSLLKV